MDEETKKRIALFRFGVIATLIGRKLERNEQEQEIRQLAQKQWEIPGSNRSALSRSTIRLWLKRYRHSGGKLESLYPKDRSDAGRSRCIDGETEEALLRLKREFPALSLPALMKVARQRAILPAGWRVSQQSVYRLFKRHGLDKPQSSPEDRRRFEVEFPNDLWQSDCMHGPQVLLDGKLRKSFLFALIDDHSRLIPHAQFYLRENIDSFRDCLMQGLQKRGLPRKLFVDNGSAFRCQRLKWACASLGIVLVYARPYQPAAKGKIERLWRTLRTQLLPLLSQPLNLQQLNERLWQWIDSDYHLRIHSSTGQPPLKRYLAHIEAIRPAPTHMKDHFRASVPRTVDKDRTVSLNGRLYEAPVGLIGKSVRLLYHPEDQSRIEVVHNGASLGFLLPLNPAVNSRIRRDKCAGTDIVPADPAAQQSPGAAPSSGRYQGGELFGEPSAER